MFYGKSCAMALFGRLPLMAFSAVFIFQVSLKAQIKKPLSPKPATAVKTVQPRLAEKITEIIPEKLYSSLNPREIAPDAVVVDADYIDRIINGRLVIRKGALQALIDLKGNFIVPWGKYDFNSYGSDLNTLIGVVKKGEAKRGFINVRGELVFPFIFEGVHFDALGYNRLAGDKITYLSDQGKVYPAIFGSNINTNIETLDLEHFPFERPVVSFYSKVSNSSGYADLNGKVVIPAQFRGVEEFVEGLAAVSKIDQFGLELWGFINLKGETVIPFKFKNRPSNFHSGLARVIPAEAANFNFGYIDHSGTVQVKIGDGNRFSPYSDGGSFTGDYVIARIDGWKRMFNRQGKSIEASTMVKSTKSKEFPARILVKEITETGYQINDYTPGAAINTSGFMDFKGNVLFPPYFSTLVPDIFSPYAIAEIKEEWVVAKKKTIKPISGVINQEGVYVLVLKKGDNF